MAKEEAVIFLVDDDELYLLRLKDHLHEKLYFKAKIYTFTSGEECLANISLEPDIVVVDYYFMPEGPTDPSKPMMNGIELIRRLKEALPDLNMIMLSCETDVEVANTALREGAKDYIIKYEYAPVQLQYLISNIMLKKSYGPKRNFWKWGAIIFAILLVALLVYILEKGAIK